MIRKRRFGCSRPPRGYLHETPDPEKPLPLPYCWRTDKYFNCDAEENIGMEYGRNACRIDHGRGCSENRQDCPLVPSYCRPDRLPYFDANTVVSENTPKDFIHLSKKATQSGKMRWPVSYRPVSMIPLYHKNPLQTLKWFRPLLKKRPEPFYLTC